MGIEASCRQAILSLQPLAARALTLFLMLFVHPVGPVPVFVL